jgi:hypothetical protein
MVGRCSRFEVMGVIALELGGVITAVDGRKIHAEGCA